jgi:hypothetical protein
LRIAGVSHAQPPAASPAGHDAGEERSATATGLDPSGTTVIVEGELLLIALELVPADVALVMIFDQNIAFIDRATYATPHALAAVLDTYLARRAAKA